MGATTDLEGHNMKVIKKSEAAKIAGATMKYCNGKYNWNGSQMDYVGRDIEGANVLALWVERRTDEHGPYARLMCKV